MSDANSTKTPNGDDCYEVAADDVALLESTNTGRGATINGFQSLVGSLLWVARCSRPAIAIAVHKATRQAHAPRVLDWKLAKRVARYLKGSAKLKLGSKRVVTIFNFRPTATLTTQMTKQTGRR